jgi:amino acid transporter
MLGRLGRSGQMNTGIVWGVIIMLVSIAIGGLVFGKIQTEAAKQANDECSAVDTIAENVVAQTGTAGTSIFPLIILMVTVAVFVGIISVLKYLG